MINKNFKRDWEIFGGEIELLLFEHLEISIDKDGIGFGLEFSWVYRLLYFKFLNLVFRVF